MFRTLTSWLKAATRKPPAARNPATAKARLGMLRLEDRANPVVIGNAIHGEPYNLPALYETGVVQVGGPAGRGTGTLLSTGRHVLTASHVLTDSAGMVDQPSLTIRFEAADHSPVD